MHSILGMDIAPCPPMKYPRTAILCLVGALEKFGFNGLRAMLVLYFAKSAGKSDADATALYGTFMALGFLTPLLGGWIADRFLGAAKTMRAGAVLAALGLLALLIPGSGLFNMALAALILGAGFIKSNVTTLIGRAAESENLPSQKAFTALYMSFNVGTLLGALLCAMLGEIYGWTYGFAAAGMAMILAAAVPLNGERRGKQNPALALPLTLAVLPALAFIISHSSILRWALPTLTGAAIVLMMALAAKDGRESVKNALTILSFMAFHTVFFALYEQGSLSLVLFAENHVDRSLEALVGFGGARPVPTTFFQTIDPFLNVALGLGALILWRKPAGAPKDNHHLKFAAGFLAMAAGFMVLSAFSVMAARDGSQLSPWALILAYGLFVAGEIFTIPTGFAIVSAKAPPQHAGLFMGIWFLSIAGSEWLAAALAGWMAESYVSSFQILSGAAMALAMVMAVAPLLRRVFPARSNWFDFAPPSV